MALEKQFPAPPADSSHTDWTTFLQRKGGFSLKQPSVMFSGDEIFLTPLLVFGKQEPYLELGGNKIDPNHQKMKDKIDAVLKCLAFREQRVLVQFWSPLKARKHQLLTTIDQPFGLGVIDEGLCSFRMVSERSPCVLVEDHGKEGLSPPARVFTQGFPEWTPDVTNYLIKHFPQQERAICCDLHGYLALPVFDTITKLCVGVLELLTSLKHMSYAYEVQQLHKALETQNLTIPQGFDFPALHAPNERRQNVLDRIHSILKVVCDVHSLPLAQTWAVSQQTCYVSLENVIENSCSSFDTRCVGKVCMSTAALPFYVKDLRTWSFREACRARHLDRSHGLIGKALLSRGSCCCGDVTKLSEEEYPLVHDAHMNGLTRCFAIFLHIAEADNDYVLEFFLPPDEGHVLSLVQTLKQNIMVVGSGFELGDSSCIQVVGLPADLSVYKEPDVIQTRSLDSVSDNFMFLMDSSDSESPVDKTCATITHAGETTERLKRSKKRKTDSVAVEVTFNGYVKNFHVPVSLGLENLENEVAQRFGLTGKRLRLKYTDENDDLILVACDDDLNAVSGSNNSISLICWAN